MLTWMTSGRFFRSSLYTVAEDAQLLRPSTHISIGTMGSEGSVNGAGKLPTSRFGLMHTAEANDVCPSVAMERLSCIC